MSYVYALLNLNQPDVYNYGDVSFDYRPFYIGSSSDKKRMYLHCKNKNGNSLVYKYINYLKKYEIPFKEIIIFDNLSRQCAYEIEYELIKIIGRVIKNKKDGLLYNTSPCNTDDYNKNKKFKVNFLMNKNNDYFKTPKSIKINKQINWEENAIKNLIKGCYNLDEMAKITKLDIFEISKIIKNIEKEYGYKLYFN